MLRVAMAAVVYPRNTTLLFSVGVVTVVIVVVAHIGLKEKKKKRDICQLNKPWTKSVT